MSGPSLEVESDSRYILRCQLGRWGSLLGKRFAGTLRVLPVGRLAAEEGRRLAHARAAHFKLSHFGKRSMLERAPLLVRVKVPLSLNMIGRVRDSKCVSGVSWRLIEQRYLQTLLRNA